MGTENWPDSRQAFQGGRSFQSWVAVTGLSQAIEEVDTEMQSC